jgi:hypothetical protein
MKMLLLLGVVGSAGCAWILAHDPKATPVTGVPDDPYANQCTAPLGCPTGLGIMTPTPGPRPGDASADG